MRFYGVDYLDVGTFRLSYRRLRNLIRHLPRESSTVTAAVGDDALWGHGEHLLATVVDLLQSANYQRGGGKGSQPTPYPRPGRKGNRVGKTTKPPREVARYLAQFQPSRD